ncbi:hypothetical protein ACFW34_09765 [Streptomyces sp. NPDC058848]|uniref:hypothetical protein n=1 Tax=unclassified Streptomyces TaxID=2593676 RepID=UPI0036BF235F
MSETRYFFSNPVAEKVREEGWVEGREEGRVADMDQLEVWAQRAVTAERAEELFSG